MTPEATASLLVPSAQTLRPLEKGEHIRGQARPKSPEVSQEGVDRALETQPVPRSSHAVASPGRGQARFAP